MSPKGKGGRYVWLACCYLHIATVSKFWDPQSSRSLTACPGLYRHCFYTGVLISPYPDQEGTKLMFLSEWREFPWAPCHAGKKPWWQLASRYCWNRARPWRASELVSFLVGLRTYQHPGIYWCVQEQGCLSITITPLEKARHPPPRRTVCLSCMSHACLGEC